MTNSAMFVDTTRVPVRLDEAAEAGAEVDTIYIKPKMNYADRAAMQDQIIKVKAIRNDGTADQDTLVGTANLALLQINIVAWSGPSFAGVACTPENIAKLDPDGPLVEKVLAELQKRNARPKGTTGPKP